MDTLKNGIPAEMYYKLLEWKDENIFEWVTMYDYKKSLNELSEDELYKLYSKVIES